MIVLNVLKISLLRKLQKNIFKSIVRPYNKDILHNKFKHRKNYIWFLFFQMFYVSKMEPLKSFPLQRNEKNSENILTPQSAITEADELFLVGKFEESCNALLPFKESDDVEVLWRLSRALYYMSKQKEIDKIRKESCIEEAYDYVQRALVLSDKNYAVHKWMAILTDAKSSLKGIKEKIRTLPIFKEHLMIAIELNPKDATSFHMLGQYMYNIADMTWLQMKIAQSFFGTIPKASFEEAFQYFSKAEEIDPNFYSANLLMLGKTCLKLNRLQAAHYWLKCATSYPVRTDEDKAVKLKAEELLKTNPTTTKE